MCQSTSRSHSSPRSQTARSRPRSRDLTPDEQAVERYRYLLRTAPPETIEEAHAEAFRAAFAALGYVPCDDEGPEPPRGPPRRCGHPGAGRADR